MYCKGCILETLLAGAQNRVSYIAYLISLCLRFLICKMGVNNPYFVGLM